MKIAVLTSSRADYGIYLPLLKAMNTDDFFDFGLIVFGTHLSEMHGKTAEVIRQDGFRIDHEIDHVVADDSPEGIANSMANVMGAFATIWEKEKQRYDLVLCLGDRYEMFAAVAAAVPFRLKIAHLHGGETTLGAIDNEFRHCITLFSSLHFVAVPAYAERVAELKANDKDIYIVGALSLDNLKNTRLLQAAELKEKFQIDFERQTLLVTFHPETNSIENVKEMGRQVVAALQAFPAYQIVITMPNADTMGNSLRRIYQEYAASDNNVKLVENFGTQGYFSAMKLSALVIGNSSSGIIEAASLGRYVVDIGDRQKGRESSDNVLHAPPVTTHIIEAIEKGLSKGEYKGENIYYKKDVAKSIIDILKNGTGRSI